MRAAIFVGQEQPLSIEDVEQMPPGPQDVVVRIGASGVCHSDLSVVHGYVPLPPRMTPGSTVAAMGCGGVGQAVIQGARIAGASRIFAVDPVELKRKTAEQQGATDLVDPGQGDSVAQVQALTGGRGVDYAFEVIGLPETVVQAYGMA